MRLRDAREKSVPSSLFDPKCEKVSPCLEVSDFMRRGAFTNYKRYISDLAF